MPLSPELKKLAQQAIKIQGSKVPVYRALDILASTGGDVTSVLGSYSDIDAAALRRAFHGCAELLRAIEREAGATPQWEQALQPRPAASGPSASPVPASAPSAAAKTPDDLRPFVDESARGQVRVAKAYTDGASKGNPGQAGIGVVIFTMDGRKIAQQAKAIGIATNNIAEYSALIEAMTMAQDLGIRVLNVISDSELMVRQVSGVYKIKNVDILKKAQEVMELRRGFEKFSISYVGREHNKIADALSTSLLKKPSSRGSARPSSAKAAPGAPDDEYRDMLGPVDPNADEGATE
jgi:ribonuclease HI